MVKARKHTPMTDEELAQRDLARLLEDHIPEPTRFFSVGERVDIGALDYCEILESHAGGKVYLVRTMGAQNPESARAEIYDRLGAWAWMDIFKHRTVEENSKIAQRYNDKYLHPNYQQREVSSLLYSSYHGGIDMDPPYQRGLVWSEENKRELIRSIFRDVDLGKFVLIRKEYTPGGDWYEILDGKQRLSALKDFYEDRLEVDGKRYSDLCWRDQSHFDHYPVSWAEVAGISEVQKLELFLRVNVAGVPQDPEHLRRISDRYQEVLLSGA